VIGSHMVSAVIYNSYMLVAGEDKREVGKERERVQGYERYYENEDDIDRQVAVREVVRANSRYTWAVIGWMSVKVASGQIRPDEVISMVCAPLMSLILMF
jgi:hypothetical protein